MSFNPSLLKKLIFIRNMVYGMGRKEAWVSAFDCNYSEKLMCELCSDVEFQGLREKYEAEIRSTGEARDSCILEIEELKRQAAEVGERSDSPKDRLEAIKVQMKGVETKARISRKLGDKQEINVSVALPIMSDEAMLRAMEGRASLPSGGADSSGVIEADFTEIGHNGEDK